jgi:hypothetical protein
MAITKNFIQNKKTGQWQADNTNYNRPGIEKAGTKRNTYKTKEGYSADTPEFLRGAKKA